MKTKAVQPKSEWRKLHLVLPDEIRASAKDWHGGPRSPSKALATKDLVSLSLIDGSLEELRSVLRLLKEADARKNLRRLLVRLEEIRLRWPEYTHEAVVGTKLKRDEIEYDERTVGTG